MYSPERHRYDPNSAKKSEVEHFLRGKDLAADDLSILDGEVPERCKKMGNRRIKPSPELGDADTDNVVLDKLLFYSDMYRDKAR